MTSFFVDVVSEVYTLMSFTPKQKRIQEIQKEGGEKIVARAQPQTGLQMGAKYIGIKHKTLLEKILFFDLQ